MYRNGEMYDEMCNVVMDIYEDYGITLDSFPLDMDWLIEIMGMDLVPYSAFPCHKDLLIKKSKDGFCVPSDGICRPAVIINDTDSNYGPGKISSNKGHEVKHIVFLDTDDSEDDSADYFSKYLRCPIPLVINLGIKSKTELISKFKITGEQADYVLSNARNRVNKYGRRYFRYELRLFEQLLGENYIESDFEIID